MVARKICLVCRHDMKPAFLGVVLGKHEVTYYHCDECGVLQTEKPYWLGEAYEKPVAAADTGLVRRNVCNFIRLGPILRRLFKYKGKFLDVAGGYGLLASMMRDLGIYCYTTDKYCANLFAADMEPGAGFKADALFAFEVLEHVENPLEFIGGLFNEYGCKTLIFSTLVYDDVIPDRDWWYYSFESGQHITFYQPRTLALLASKLGCSHYMIGRDLHIITDVEISGVSRLLLTNERLFRMYCIFTLYWNKKHSEIWNELLFIKDEVMPEGKPLPPNSP